MTELSEFTITPGRVTPKMGGTACCRPHIEDRDTRSLPNREAGRYYHWKWYSSMGWGIHGAVLLLLGLAVYPVRATGVANLPTVITIVGAGGEDEYGEEFVRWAKQTREAAGKGDVVYQEIGLESADDQTDRDRLRLALEKLAPDGADELWLILLGHGTDDGREARFNLRGPDVTATELASWLERFQRPVAIINCASSSGAFIKKLSKPGRIVVTATKSGNEQNYARFGKYFAAALGDPKADLDKDGQTSLLEGFLFASAQAREFYKSEGRLATEHAILDDNGDGRGTPADWFRGVQATRKAGDGAAVDGRRAHQFHLDRGEFERDWEASRRARRDEVEMQVWALRDEKEKLPEEEYYQKLEPLLLEMARLGEPPPVIPPKVISQQEDGAVLLPARDVTVHGKSVRYEPQAHKNTIGYWTKAEDWVSWDFELSKGGRFSVEVMQACGKGSGGSEYSITVGGQSMIDVVPDTGAFTNFVRRVIGKVQLPEPGRYTLAVKPISKPGQAVMDLRAVTLKPEQ